MPRPYGRADAAAHAAALGLGGGVLLLGLDALSWRFLGEFGALPALFPLLWIVVWPLFGARPPWAVLSALAFALVLAMLGALGFALSYLVGFLGLFVLVMAFPALLGATAAAALLPLLADDTPGTRRLRQAHVTGALLAGVFATPLWIFAVLPGISLHSEPGLSRVSASLATDLLLGALWLGCLAPHAVLAYLALAEARRNGEALGPDRPWPRVAALALGAYVVTGAMMAWGGDARRAALWPLEWMREKEAVRVADRRRVEEWLRENAPP